MSDDVKERVSNCMRVQERVMEVATEIGVQETIEAIAMNVAMQATKQDNPKEALDDFKELLDAAFKSAMEEDRE